MNGADRDRRARLAVTLLAWLWAGLVLGVSFVATPVKFLAPSLSLADALAVGRVTFEGPEVDRMRGGGGLGRNGLGSPRQGAVKSRFLASSS